MTDIRNPTLVQLIEMLQRLPPETTVVRVESIFICDLHQMLLNGIRQHGHMKFGIDLQTPDSTTTIESS